MNQWNPRSQNETNNNNRQNQDFLGRDGVERSASACDRKHEQIEHSKAKARPTGQAGHLTIKKTLQTLPRGRQRSGAATKTDPELRFGTRFRNRPGGEVEPEPEQAVEMTRTFALGSRKDGGSHIAHRHAAEY